MCVCGGGQNIFYINNFTYERIEIKIMKSMSDSELSRLGVTTIGKRDRYWKNAHIMRSWHYFVSRYAEVFNDFYIPKTLFAVTRHIPHLHHFVQIPATANYASFPSATPATLGPENSGDIDLSLSRAPVEALYCEDKFWTI